MLYIPKINDCAAINSSECFKSMREEQNLRKVTTSLYIFLTTPDQVAKYVQSDSSDNCISLYNV